MFSNDPCFIFFERSIDAVPLPEQLNNPFDSQPHKLCKMAAQQIQEKLPFVSWDHNFGLGAARPEKAIGKMFGVLVVKNRLEEIGFLAAFSGKVGGANHYNGFVPPVFDVMKEGSFLDQGMDELTRLNQEIDQLKGLSEENNRDRIAQLTQQRRDNSNALQDHIYDNYQFLNQKGEVKGLREIFASTHHANPPGGAGDCAAPKLLQYAFQNDLIPLAMAEFWWGACPKSGLWKHKQYYPSCTHKCAPILEFMLAKIELKE